MNWFLLLVTLLISVSYSIGFSKKDCSPPSLPGLCRARMHIYYWNGKACVPGMYGGCRERQKIFHSKADCERIAKPVCS
ncbi:kappaPI-actitoxin-Avd3b [Coccinella septempunctata]|uniref:kappaPI-actitoxin-Avd3b n=1 Tax=Coccinella septempunctata TaxID=41139 RepID=UPI001D0662A4|nr:kappaPI-actitoxin-Avd3b [Coccinella septempunctata]